MHGKRIQELEERFKYRSTVEKDERINKLDSRVKAVVNQSHAILQTNIGEIKQKI
jgi:hypothetical protein